MIDFPKISIVTANLNGAKFLEKTIRSVLDQEYPNLEYIVMDGGSTDDSVNIIRKFSDKIAYWESAPDGGTYDAIRKGFERSTGEIMGWINSDDLLLFNSLFTIAEIFSLSPKIQWLQGHPVVIDENNRLVYQRLPVVSRLNLLRKEYHDGRFIQQESTFWTRKLWVNAGGFISPDYRYAADFELWMRFFNHAPLHFTQAMLGAFRIRKEGQISRTNYNEYLAECDKIIDMQIEMLTGYNKEFIQYGKSKKKWFLNIFDKGDKTKAFLPTDSNTAPLCISFDFSTQSFKIVQ